MCLVISRRSCRVSWREYIFRRSRTPSASPPLSIPSRGTWPCARKSWPTPVETAAAPSHSPPYSNKPRASPIVQPDFPTALPPAPTSNTWIVSYLYMTWIESKRSTGWRITGCRSLNDATMERYVVVARGACRSIFVMCQIRANVIVPLPRFLSLWLVTRWIWCVP